MTKQTVSDNSANKLSLLVLTCFFFSGLTGLIYEILWTRMLVTIIGGAPFAVSIILTVFMGGLGLGSYFASRVIDRISEPARLVKIYGILELMIGGYGLAIPVLLRLFRPIYAVVYNQLFSYFMLYNFLTFIGCAILLCLPVICMGATLPILCRFYVRRLSHLGTYAGRLYGLNTIGAALGAFLCGFWLISVLSMPGTLILAVLINVFIGLSCIMAGWKVRTKQIVSDLGQQKQTAPSQEAKPSGYPAVVVGSLVIFAVSGFCAMSYEVIWTRLLGLLVGPTTYSFTIVLVTFILGLALGSMLFGWLGDRMDKPVLLLILTQIVAALFALLLSQVLGNSQLFFAKLIYHFQDNFAALSIFKAVILFVFMLFPTVCLGATFPLVGKIYTQSVSRVGRSIGVAYAINTIGAVLGSFCAGFVLIPFFGKERGLSLVIGFQLLTSLVILGIIFVRDRKVILKLASLAVAALFGLFLCFHFPMWDHHLLSKGRYHRFEDMGVDLWNYSWLESLFRGPEILSRSEHSELVYYGDGIGGFTTVLRQVNPLGDMEYTMTISGKADASSRADMQTQALSAHFPMLFHRNPRTVMVLGLASGVTAGEVLYYPVEQLDVLEISHQVVEASDFFLPWNNRVLSDSRTNLIIQDGRAHLQLTKQKYDVIISEPSNPWMAGLAALFTSEFFALAEDRLNEDGIFVQFIHSYQMDWPTFALVGRTFAQVFPNSVLVITAPSNVGNDYLLVGFKGKDRLILENAERKLPYVQQSKNITLSDPRLLYRLIVSEDVQGFFGRGPVNTDSWPVLEFAAPKLLYHSDPMIERNIRAKRWLSPATRDIIQQVTADINAQIDFAAYALSVYRPFSDMVDLEKATPLQKKRFFELMEVYCANNPMDYSIFKDEELKQRCCSIQIEAIQNRLNLSAGKKEPYFYLANLYYMMDALDEAIAKYSTLLQFEPGNAEAHSNLGIALIRQNKVDEAIKHFKEALRIKPDFAEAHGNLAYALVRQGKLGEAVKEYYEVIQMLPDNSYAHNDLGIILLQQGRLDEAIQHFQEALRNEPDFARAHYNLGTAYARQGKLEEAIEHFKEALRINSDFADARESLQKAILQQNNEDKK
jgi:spermidine synthase